MIRAMSSDDPASIVSRFSGEVVPMPTLPVLGKVLAIDPRFGRGRVNR